MDERIRCRVLELSGPGAIAIVDFSHVFPERRSLVEDGHPQELDEGPEIIKRVLNRGPGQTPSDLRRYAAHSVELLARTVPNGMCYPFD